jgi:hypothetical protein
MYPSQNTAQSKQRRNYYKAPPPGAIKKPDSGGDGKAKRGGIAK